MLAIAKYIYIISFLCISFLLYAQNEPMEKLGEIVLQAEQAPMWAYCENANNTEACTQEQMQSYIKDHLAYPKDAQKQKIEGEVVVSCIITNKGEILKPGIVKDIGGGCGKEALRIVKQMPLWKPAYHQGKPVNTIFNITIPFELDILSLSKKILIPEPVKPQVPSKDTLPDGDTRDEQLLPASYEDTNIGRVYTRVSQMPYFQGCNALENNTPEKRSCSHEQLISYLKNTLQYPEDAEKKGIEGIVSLSFIIDEKGNVLEPKIVRDIGGGCGEEALRVVSEMPVWEAGREKNRPVKTKMTLPVRFYFSSDESEKYQIHWGSIRKNSLAVKEVTHYLKEDIIVRNLYGDDMTITSLVLSYEKGRKVREAKSNGKITHEMMRLLRKVKPKGELFIEATIQEDGKQVSVYRLFKIVK